MKRLLFLLLLILPFHAHAAIAIDTQSTGGQTTSANNLTWSHTVTGTNPMLWVGVGEENANDITGVTYNGVALTGLTQSNTPTGAGFSQLWYLVGPATGAHNIVVSRTGTTGRLVADAASYTGAAQSGQPDAQNNSTATAATSYNVGNSATVVASNAWLVGYSDNSVGNPSAGTGTVIRQQGSDASTLVDSNGTVGTGAQTLTLTGTSRNWSGAIASFAPSVAVPAVIKVPDIMFFF